MIDDLETSTENLESTVGAIVTPAANGKLTRRESRTLEFKEQFNFAALADYFKDFAAFANNAGGYLVFGVTDSPRTAASLSKKSIESFENLDSERISGFLNELFSCEIVWDAICFEKDGKTFAAFGVQNAKEKPVICTKDEGKEQTLKNGAIYYRYGGRTQVIRAPELQAIIASRIEQTNAAWINHVQQVGVAGPNKAVLLNETELGATETDARFVVDRELAKKIKFVKEGHFKEDADAPAMRLVGDVTPVDAVEVEKLVEENLFEKYPYTGKAPASEVAGRVSGVKQRSIWKASAENGLKGDPSYSVYNFRNPAQRKKFEDTGQVSSTVPVLYNETAIDFLVEVLTD